MKARMLLQNQIANFLRGTRNPQGEKGQAAVLVALMLVGLLAFAGLVFDGGTAYAQRRVAQNAADAAAFGAARITALNRASHNTSWTGDCEVLYAVQSMAVANGITGSTLASDCSGTRNPNVNATYMEDWDVMAGVPVGNGYIPADVLGIKVEIQTSFNTLFLKVVNRQVGTVGATAIAQFGTPTGPVGPIMPVTVNITDINNGNCSKPKSCTLEGDKLGPGGFAWLDFTTKGNSKCGNPAQGILAGWLTPPPNQSPVPPFSVGDWICSLPGSKGGSVTPEMNAWLAKQLENRVWIVPVYDVDNGLGGNNMKYHIKRLAAFRITGWVDTGNPKYIQGQFIDWATAGSNAGDGDCATPPTVCAVSLRQ